MEAVLAINLSIKGVPDGIAERLRARAELNHRSLQGELMSIIEQAAAELDAPRGMPSSADAPATWRPIGVRRGTKGIEQLAAEHLARFPQPFADLPLAVDIIRADRDSR